MLLTEGEFVNILLLRLPGSAPAPHLRPSGLQEGPFFIFSICCPSWHVVPLLTCDNPAFVSLGMASWMLHSGCSPHVTALREELCIAHHQSVTNFCLPAMALHPLPHPHYFHLILSVSASTVHEAASLALPLALSHLSLLLYPSAILLTVSH